MIFWSYCEKSRCCLDLCLSVLCLLLSGDKPGLAAEPTKGFVNGLGPIQIGQKWGFINDKGEISIPAQYDDVCSFAEGLAAVNVDGKWGYIDQGGMFRVRPEYDYAPAFREGLAPLRFGNKWGYIDTKGRIAIPPRFDVACPFHEGLGRVTRDGHFAFVDRKGKVVLQPNVTRVSDFSEGLAPFYGDEPKIYGFLDRDGNVAITPMFRQSGVGKSFGFSCGRALVADKGRFGYIDKTGKAVIPFRFDDATEFRESLACVVDTRTLKRGYIDTGGSYVLPPQYDSAGDFCEGLAGVTVNARRGYIDRCGRFVIELKGGGALSNFSGGFSWVEGPKPGWFGYINIHGNYLWGPLPKGGKGDK